MSTPDESPGTYATQVTITFNQVSGRPGGPVIDSYEVKFDPNGAIDLDWLRDEIKDLFLYPEPDPETGIRYLRDSYVLTQTREDVNWGASGTVVQFLVETAAFVGEHGVDAVVGYGVAELVQRLRSRGYDAVAGKPEELSDDEAIRFGLQAIETDYATTLSDLYPKSVRKNEFGQYVVTAGDSGGSTYTVTFVVRGGMTKVVSRDHTFPTDN